MKNDVWKYKARKILVLMVFPCLHIAELGFQFLLLECWCFHGFYLFFRINKMNKKWNQEALTSNKASERLHDL